ncbi:MAG: cation:proton antiporter [Legionellaceae bacterium]|nr:cation:proton antiporter [Legionellaceae bacterium]
MSMVLILAFILLILAGVCCFVRMILGPSLPDSVVALDLLTNILMAAVGLFSIYVKNAIYLDIVVALALIMFLGSTFFARYLEKKGAREET